MNKAKRNRLDWSLPLLILIGMAVSASTVSAGVNRWTSSGPLGLFVNSLAIDPKNPDTVYTVMSQRVLKSRDGGVSWTTSLEPSPGLDQGDFGGGLAIDPVSPSNIYAATHAGLFKSVDAGSSWKAIGDHAPVYSLAIDPFAPSNVFAGTAGGIFKSNDGGGSWSGMLSSASIYSLVFSRQSPAVIFGADFDSSFYYPNNSTLYQSTDEGVTWTHSDGPTSIPPGALAVDPASPSTLYAGSLRGISGLFKSTDSGLTWSLVNDGSYVTSFAIDPQNSKTIYAGTNSGFVQSTDGGVSWHGFNTGRDSHPIWITAMAIDQTGTRLYAGTDSGEVLGYQISSTGSRDQSAALDLSVGKDNNTRVLFDDPDNRALFRRFDNSGNSTTDGFHGPYSGWRPRAVADGTDGLTRVLWNNVDGSAALWLLGQTGNQASYLYGPSTGGTAVDVSVGSDAATNILWTNTDGRTELTSVANSGALVTDTTYGPFIGWIARSISDGSDGLTRILWSNNDGRVGLSLVDAGHIAATYRFAPGPGWTALDVAVAGDNRARILFVNADDSMVLWTVDNSGVVTDSGTVYAPPQSGQTAVRVSAGAEGLTRVLWTSAAGTGSVFAMGLDNVVQGSFHFCGDSGESSACGDWDY